MNMPLKPIRLQFAVGLLCAGCRLLNAIPPSEVTASAMTEVRFRINMYLEKEHKLPASLSELPQRSGFDNRTTDGWGHLLVYAVNGDVVTLTSHGRDDKPGGSGENSDEVRHYQVVVGKLQEVDL